MNSFSDFFWLLVWAFVFACYLIVLFQIVVDLFRDRDLSGWWKAIWIIFLIIVPFLSALIYVIARGRGMAERHQACPGRQAKRRIGVRAPARHEDRQPGRSDRHSSAAARQWDNQPDRVRPAEAEGAGVTPAGRSGGHTMTNSLS